jgi:hypothetical protein
MTSTQWANIGDDAGALHALLQQLPQHVPVELIDQLWIFPPRRVAIGESIVIVIGGRDADDQRRRVMTAHFTVARSRKGIAQVGARFDEHGTAQEDAVPRIVQGVLRRLGEEVGAEPREEQISGDIRRWDALIIELGGRIAATPAPPRGESSTDPAPTS